MFAVMYYSSGWQFETFEDEEKAIGFAVKKKGVVLKVMHSFRESKIED